MSIKAPSYLLKNRHGTYYFRVAIPCAIRHSFDGRRELRKSLGTKCPRKAISLARALKVHFDEALSAEVNTCSSIPADDGVNPQQIITLKKVQLGADRSIEEIIIEAKTPEQEAQIAQHLLSLPAQPSNQDLPDPEADLEPGPLLSKVIEEYSQEHITLRKWGSKTAAQQHTSFNLLTSILGDVPFDSLNHSDLRRYKQTLLKLPPNMNKVARYRDKSIDEILAMDKVESMAVNTINRHLITTSSLFKWAQRHGYTDVNYAEGLTVGKDKSPRDERQVFAPEDLQHLCGTEEFKSKFDTPYKYWVTLLGLYTGARLEEICQLRVEDIRQEKDVWIIDINGDYDKKLKNKNAKRIIPIHPKLLELGFLDRVNFLRFVDQERLFPDLKKGRDGYGTVASKWFARYRAKCGITEAGKVFHSFRHTFIDHLKQKGVAIDKIAALVGHEDQSMTSGRYGKQYGADLLLEVVKLVDYDLELMIVNEEVLP